MIYFNFIFCNNLEICICVSFSANVKIQLRIEYQETIFFFIINFYFIICLCLIYDMYFIKKNGKIYLKQLFNIFVSFESKKNDKNSI